MGTQKFNSDIDVNGDLTVYDPVNDGNPVISLGKDPDDRLAISTEYHGGAQTLNWARFTTHTTSTAGNAGRMGFYVDEDLKFQIYDAGVNIGASSGLLIGGVDILTDASGTTTLNNIDALDATTEATIEAAIDTLANLTSVGTISTGGWRASVIGSSYTTHVMHYDFQGYATGDGTNYEMANNLSDTNAPFEHNISLGADGTTATTIQNIIRSGGKVMPRACTLKRWTGWAAAAGGQTAYVALFKVTPTRNSNTALSAVLLDAFSYTALGNAKMEDFDETSFAEEAIAAGDILITAMKSQSGAIHYFTSTVEVEF